MDQFDLVMQSAQEADVGTLVEDIKAMACGSRMIVGYAPVRNSKSNGLIERTVMIIKEHLKVMKAALESKW